MRSVAQAMNREDLIEDRVSHNAQRYKNMDAFVAEIESWSETLTAEQCEAPPVYHAVSILQPDLFEHPQIKERGAFKQMQDNDGHRSNLPVAIPPLRIACRNLASIR